MYDIKNVNLTPEGWSADINGRRVQINVTCLVAAPPKRMLVLFPWSGMHFTALAPSEPQQVLPGQYYSLGEFSSAVMAHEDQDQTEPAGAD